MSFSNILKFAPVQKADFKICLTDHSNDKSVCTFLSNYEIFNVSCEDFKKKKVCEETSDTSTLGSFTADVGFKNFFFPTNPFLLTIDPAQDTSSSEPKS